MNVCQLLGDSSEQSWDILPFNELVTFMPSWYSSSLKKCCRRDKFDQYRLEDKAYA